MTASLTNYLIFTVGIDHDEDDQVAPLWREMEVRLKSAFCNPEHGPELVEEMETLLEEGLEWNALGLRLLAKRMVDEGQKDPMLPLPIRMTKEQRDILSSLYLAPSDHTTITWDLDVLHNGRKSLILAPQEIPDISGYQWGFGCQFAKAYITENPVTNQKIL